MKTILASRIHNEASLAHPLILMYRQYARLSSHRKIGGGAKMFFSFFTICTRLNELFSQWAVSIPCEFTILFLNYHFIEQVIAMKIADS